MAAAPQGHHHLRRHREQGTRRRCLPACPTRSRTWSASPSPPSRPAPRSSICTPATPRTAVRRRTRRSSSTTSRASRTRPTRSSRITSGGGTGMSVDGAAAGHLRDPARAVHAQPRHFQLRQLPDDPEVRRHLEVRLGGALPREHADRAVREHVRRHRAHAQRRPRRRPARASSTRPTTSATSTRWPTISTPVWSSRRSSCRRSSASWAASAPRSSTSPT